MGQHCTNIGCLLKYCSGRVGLLVCMAFYMSARPSVYLKSNERICMRPDVCLGPRINRLNFVMIQITIPIHDPDYDPDLDVNFYQMCASDPGPIHYILGMILKSGSRIRITITNFGGGLLSLTDSLVIQNIVKISTPVKTNVEQTLLTCRG